MRPARGAAPEPARLLAAPGSRPRAQAPESRALADARGALHQPRAIRAGKRGPARRDEYALQRPGGALLHGDGPAVPGIAVRLEPALPGRSSHSHLIR